MPFIVAHFDTVIVNVRLCGCRGPNHIVVRATDGQHLATRILPSFQFVAAVGPAMVGAASIPSDDCGRNLPPDSALSNLAWTSVEICGAFMPLLLGLQ